MTKMWSLLSLVVLAALTTALTANERMYNRLLGPRKEVKRTKEEQLVDDYMTVLDHISRDKNPQLFNGQNLLNMLEKKKDVPFLASLEKKFRPIHDASKSGVHELGVILDLFEEISEEAGINFYDLRIIEEEHELYKEVSQRLNPNPGH